MSIMNCTEFEKLENGKLRIKFVGNEDDKIEILEMLEKQGSNSVLMDITESHWTNSWAVFPDADVLGQMSNCPVICEDGSVEDDGSNTLYGKAWYFPNYMIIGEVDEIVNTGFVDFELWQDFEEATNFPNPYIN